MNHKSRLSAQDKIRDIDVFLHFPFQGGFKFLAMVVTGMDNGLFIQGDDPGPDGFDQPGQVTSGKVGPAGLAHKNRIAGKEPAPA